MVGLHATDIVPDNIQHALHPWRYPDTGKPELSSLTIPPGISTILPRDWRSGEREKRKCKLIAIIACVLFYFSLPRLKRNLSFDFYSEIGVLLEIITVVPLLHNDGFLFLSFIKPKEPGHCEKPATWQSPAGPEFLLRARCIVGDYYSRSTPS